MKLFTGFPVLPALLLCSFASPIAVVFEAAAADGLVASITAPANGAIFTGPTNITITADANSTTGTVASVAFFQSTTKLGEDGSAPYSLTWSNVSPGFYSLSALAIDATGFSRTSAPANITVNASGAPTTNTLVPLGTQWRYLDDGSNQGTNWSQLSFNASSWSNGIAPLGYCLNGCVGYGLVTTVRFGPDSANKYITTYFLRGFNVDDVSRVNGLTLNLLRDDGAVVYINGREVYRIDMGDSPVDYLTPASVASNYPFVQSELPPHAIAALVSGVNVLAVEVHQNNGTSSDIILEAELKAVIAASTNLPPIVSLTAPPNGTTLAAPANVALAALAADNESAITNVAFYSNGTRLANDASSPFGFAWNNVAAGNYPLTAVATDSTGLSATSSVVNLVVSANTAAPVVFGKTPAPGSLTNLTEITVTFSKAVTGLNASDLLVSGVPAIGLSGSGSNYTFTFPQPAYGAVPITWAVGHGITDVFTPPAAFNRTGPGATWQYQLLDGVPPVVAALDPVPNSTVAALASVSVTFSEPVTGVNASDLRINTTPAATLSGSGAGPYTFGFAQPPEGSVQVAWAASHGIQDASANAFAGASWSYTLDTNSTGVIISEIMYHPSSENVLEEYIELFNKGASAVALDGWRFSAGVQFTFPAVSIPAGGYLVVAADTAAFNAKYPGVANVVGGWTGMLNNNAEDIDLDDALGDRVDSVEYADEGDWGVRQRGPLERADHRGWVWFKEHDGLGKSLELINPNLSNNDGQNWAASRVVNGTPGVANSVLTNNLAPMILGASHLPVIPTSSEAVTVTARIVDESAGGLAVKLHYRAATASPLSFTTNVMHDDGLNGDGAAGDGVFSVIVPAQPNNTVVEFFLSAVDQQGAARTWPAPAIAAADGAGPTGQLVNALYQVDDATYSGSQPFYKLIMTEIERAELAAIPGQSDLQGPNSQMNGTFLSVDGAGTSLHYLVGLRNRGHGSRTANPPNYRVSFRSDDPWKNVTGINLNVSQVHAQHLGSVLARKSGVAGANTIPVQVRVNNQNRASSGAPMFGSYAANEVFNGDWADLHFPLDGDGNVYRAVRDINPPDFTYRGENQNAYTNTWFKESNASEDDWTDLIGMLRVMGINNATSFTTENVRQVVNVEQWLRHLAVMNLFGNAESGLNSGYNDDYYMYRGVNDPRFILSYYDLDQILGQGGSFGSTDGIFSATFNNGSGQAFDRFMHWPDFEPIYYRILKELLETTLSQSNFNATVDQTLGSYVTPGTIASIKSWMDQRRGYVLSILPPVTIIKMPVATLAGTPRSPTPLTNATLTVGGEGVVSYRRSFNGGAYGVETPVATLINLAGLASGTNTVAVIGKDADGLWQEMSNATIRQWVVDPFWPAVRLNEVLARNAAAVNHFGTFPDLIELFNEGGSPVDLSGLRLTDDPAAPNKFTFPPGTSLGVGNRLVVYANDADGTAGFHLGFSLDQNGEGVYLFDRAINGNTVLDSVAFGLQLPDLSIGRVTGGDWLLTSASFGSANVARPLGNPGTVKINEWLAAGISPNPDDFVELFNPDALPVALGGMHLTDQPIGAPGLQTIAPLSFIAGNGHAVFIDGNAATGANRLQFGLSFEQGEIALTAADQSIVDCVIYGPQQIGISRGRCPDGGLTQRTLVVPTPGAPNACPVSPPGPQTVTLIPINGVWKYDQTGTDLGTTWKDTNYNDSAWLSGPALLGFENSILGEPIRTQFQQSNIKTTFYFRVSFNLPADLNISRLEISEYIDDGAVMYLNGAELFRTNMPPGTPSFTTLAGPLNVGNAVLEGPFSVPLTNLRPGANLLAVEVHQTLPDSGDLVFGLKLDAIIVTNTPSQAGLVINEVLANNATIEEADGSKPDWVEIYNPSGSGVDLADMSLTDDTFLPRRWVFPVGSFIPAAGFLKVRLDGSLPSSATNTGFGLKANGGGVYLFHRPVDGGTPASSITYGLQAADWSIGRVPDGSANWVLNIPTIGGANLPATLGDPLQLKMNEWMANPTPGNDDWIELFNPNPQPVNLSGLRLSDSISTPKFTIAPLSFIGTGPEGYQIFWAANGADADFTGFGLSASADAVAIFTASGALISGFSWNVAQQSGVSEGLLPDGASNRVFFNATSTPGKPNFLPLSTVVVNEILTHTDPPLEDAVELFNPTGDDINIGGWYLSDSQNNLFKYRVTNGTVVPAGGFKVFYENEFNGDHPGTPFSFSSAKGDEVYLSQSITPGVLTGYRAFAEFGASENGVSFGRHRTSVGVDFTALSARTFGVDNPPNTNQFRTGTGKTNAYPKVGPIVINEIMYNYPNDTNDLREFVELHNILGTPVPLYDPANPLNTWRLRKGADFDFAPNTTIPAGGFLVVVNFNPQSDLAALATFQAAYGTSMTLVGPYGGKLDNGGEQIELQKPDAPQTVPGPDFGQVPYVAVDRIVYSDAAPWPASADGLGHALKRLTPSLYGNDPANWAGGAPTPGAANFDTGVTNTAPILGAIGNKSINEGVLLTFDATAADSEAPPQSLTFSLDAGAPSSASITPSGTFTWAPNEAHGPGVYPVTVRVTDNGSPVKSDFETISITVNDVNSAPLLDPIGNKIGNEGTLITFTATADDTDEPAQVLTYSLDAGAPATASINSAGVFTWTPTEANGPGSYPVTVRVTDNGTPAANDFETITITVNEANVAPVLDAIGNKLTTADNLLTFTATASDTDQPAQSLTFSLDAGAPSGASITSGGTFTWTPAVGQAGSNYTVTVRVSDNGPATLSDFETININVSDGRVRTTLVSFTNQWRYLATGTNLFTAWRDPVFNDSAWPFARGVFYNETTVGTVIPAPTNTFLPLTGAGGRFITNYYFRTRFVLPVGTAGVTLTASNVLDDGAVIYINGAEAQRINMNPGPVLATTFSMASWEANTTFVTNVGVGDLVTGENVLAVEVHQQSATSTDVVFGLSLTASVPSPAPVAISGVSVSPVGVVTLQWASAPGNIYRLEYKTDLSGSTWLPLGGNLPSAGTTTSTTDNVGATSSAFTGSC